MVPTDLIFHEVANDDSYRISLRIWHPTSPSKSIINNIGLNSKFSQDLGERRKNPNGMELDGFYRETYCTFAITEKVSGYFVDGVNSALPSTSPRPE
ncbi:hypothetical protein K4A87_01740 [Xanthomonas fragariae]|nr:hypothetical protein [Xanthomonas fragariae]UKR52857.1 hypothetical protein K4A87_01740 [Xanthomonas fragariae]